MVKTGDWGVSFEELVTVMTERETRIQSKADKRIIGAQSEHKIAANSLNAWLKIHITKIYSKANRKKGNIIGMCIGCVLNICLMHFKKCLIGCFL